jgi:cytochrome c peroxidase
MTVMAGRSSSSCGETRAALRARAVTLALALTLPIALGACVDESPTAAPELSPSFSHARSDSLVDAVRLLITEEGLLPMPNGPSVRFKLVRLGQALAFDKILSGNRDIACMTCHHPSLATGDERHLSIGQGARGLGEDRDHPQNLFIPRNSPALFNLHVIDNLFWDGRVSFVDGVFTTPAGAQLTPDMTTVMEFGALSALPLFPVISREEMRAFGGNELATVPDGDFRGVWAALMRRLGNIREYREMFEEAYPGTRFRDMTFAHASNAIAGFILDRLDFNRSPWDKFLAGDDDALTRSQLRGARSFMTVGNCSSCHEGNAFTDQSFQNVALAQFGPGKGHGLAGNDDFGQEGITGDPDDRYRFRTTPLRNVELTGPFGHAGQFVELRDFVDHYSESDIKLRNYNRSQIERLLRNTVIDNVDAVLANRSGRLDDLVFTDSVTNEITKFLEALTDPRARFLEGLIPFRVPSGLPVDRVRRR